MKLDSVAADNHVVRKTIQILSKDINLHPFKFGPSQILRWRDMPGKLDAFAGVKTSYLFPYRFVNLKLAFNFVVLNRMGPISGIFGRV